jgi:hypothetical protein
MSIPYCRFFFNPDYRPFSALIFIPPKVVGVTIDELMGVTPILKAARAGSNRPQRRLAHIKKLDAKEKRQILQLLDTFIERERLRRKTGTIYRVISPPHEPGVGELPCLYSPAILGYDNNWY